MTPSPQPPAHPLPRRALTRLAATGILASALVLTGCGAQDALVGLHPAPAEQSVSAPLDTDGAAAVAARLLAERDALDADPKASKEARAEVLSGDALTLATAVAGRAAGSDATELAAAPTPTVVAQSQGREWPRAILASTLDEDTSTQHLHVLLSEEPDEPFRVAASVPMFGGAELPAVAAENAGSPMIEVSDGEGLPVSPEDAVGAYAAAIAHPKPKASELVSVEDPFATGLKATAAAQTKALGKLGTLTQTHEPRLDDAVTFRLADGGAVVFGHLKRTDTLAVKPTAKELVLPAEYAKLTGKKKVTKSLTLNSLEPFVMVVPPAGKAEVIGASELLVSGTGR
ncbi:hypothetical protein GCM10023168_09140 [Fodinibacter luteus]|uniref:DUF8094 domain-containing protein n=1 Tax=Fodinibacter luteus TaxID=552064 RepID=A0ABP8K4I3_9MICO